METIGSILHTDYLLLQDFDLLSAELDQNLQKHASYLSKCNFAEFRILAPYQTPKLAINTIEAFINAQNIPGAIEYYIPVNNQSQLNRDVESIPELATKKCIAILPAENLRYETLVKQIWNMSMDGKAITILQPERVTQWRNNISLFKRLHIRGADLAFAGSTKYSLGFFHNRHLRSMHEARIIALWLTPQIYDVTSDIFIKDMAIRLKTIQSIKTQPNEL